MRKPIASILTALLLSGCGGIHYIGFYEAPSCDLARSQLTEIAAEISQPLGGSPKVMPEYREYRTIVIELPAEKKTGPGIVPYVRLRDGHSGGVVVDIGENGDGASPLARKLRDVVQQALNRHGCHSWKLDERTHDNFQP